MKRIDQKARDRERRTYRLSFSSALEVESFVGWLKAISGIRTRSSTCFEVWSTPDGIDYLLKVPWQAEYIMGELHSHLPEVRCERIYDPPRRLWVHASEYGLTRPSRPLNVDDRTALSIKGSMRSIKSGEAILVQLVFKPSPPSAKPIHGRAQTDRMGAQQLLGTVEASRDEVEERRRKLETPNFQAVLRVASTASTKTRASDLVRQVRDSLRSIETDSTRFSRRFFGLASLQRRIDVPTTPISFPSQLSSRELAGLSCWPVGGLSVAGEPAWRARTVQPSAVVPKEGRILGQSNRSGHERLVAMPYSEATKHFWALGGSGHGKTSLLTNMLIQDMRYGYGAIVFETKGDLFHLGLQHVPRERIDDVVVMDFSDFQNPVGFNILQQGNPKAAVDRIITLFQYLYGGEGGVWLRGALYHGLTALISDPRYTFADLVPLLDPRTPEQVNWAEQVIRNHPDEELRHYFGRKDNKRQADHDRYLQPTLDRVWELDRPEIRNIIGQSESTVDMQDIIANNKILFVNMSGLSPTARKLMTSLLWGSLWDVVQRNRPDKPNFFYSDECQTLMESPIDPNDMLSKSRSFNFGMVLANQYSNQLGKSTLQAIMANAATKLAFQQPADDAAILSREFGTVPKEDFQTLGRFEAYARVATSSGASAPFSLATLDLPKAAGTYQQALARSRSRFGRSVASVQAEIAARRSLPADKTKRPSIGTAEDLWGQSPT